jgi:hypothetical protein
MYVKEILSTNVGEEQIPVQGDIATLALVRNLLDLLVESHVKKVFF